MWDIVAPNMTRACPLRRYDCHQAGVVWGHHIDNYLLGFPYQNGYSIYPYHYKVYTGDKGFLTPFVYDYRLPQAVQKHMGDAAYYLPGGAFLSKKAFQACVGVRDNVAHFRLPDKDVEIHLPSDMIQYITNNKNWSKM